MSSNCLRHMLSVSQRTFKLLVDLKSHVPGKLCRCLYRECTCGYIRFLCSSALVWRVHSSFIDFRGMLLLPVASFGRSRSLCSCRLLSSWFKGNSWFSLYIQKESRAKRNRRLSLKSFQRQAIIFFKS